MRTRNKKTRNRKTRNRKKGGVLFFQTAVQDIIPEIHRFANGSTVDVANGRYGIVLRLTTTDSHVFKNNKGAITHLLVKVVAIDNNQYFNKYPLEKISVLDFEREVHAHQDICERSLEKFHCSIAPTLLYAEIFTLDQLESQFPTIHQHLRVPRGRIGLIFMEMIKADKDEYPAFNLNDYYLTPGNEKLMLDDLFPMARRLLIMLAQIGFLHNDFHLRNFLYQETPSVVYIIDFGKATRISPEQVALFETYLEETNLEKIIDFLYRGGKDFAGFGGNQYFIGYQWLKRNQTKTIVRYEDPIDPTLKIATEQAVKKFIVVEPGELLVFPPKIPYGEIDRQERERKMREEKAEAEEREVLRKMEEKRLADKKASEEQLAKESSEEKELREEKEA